MGSSASALATALHFDAEPSQVASCKAPALAYFAAASFEDARPLARSIFQNAATCARCRNLLAHRFDRLGSTLFRDEDPRMLARAFDAADRDACTVRLLAACVVLFGREREGLH
jgi:hypothetical protein